LVNRFWKVLLIAFRCNLLMALLNLENKLIIYILHVFLRHSNVFGSKCEEKTKSAVDFTHIL